MKRKGRPRGALRRSARHRYYPGAENVTVEYGPVTAEERERHGFGEGQMVNGWADQQQRKIRVVNPKDKYFLAHEMAHFVDSDALSDGDRNYFTRVMGYKPGQAWWDTDGDSATMGFRSPAEKFADYYANATVHGVRGRRAKSGGGTVAYGGIKPRRLRKFAGAIRRLGRRQGLERFRL